MRKILVPLILGWIVYALYARVTDTGEERQARRDCLVAAGIKASQDLNAMHSPSDSEIQSTISDRTRGCTR